MRHARVIGFGLLLGPWAGCSSDEAPAQKSRADDAPPASSVDEPPASDIVAAPPIAPGLPELDFPGKVRRLVEAHDDEVRRCYDASLSKHPALAGSVSIAFEIDRPGKVTHSRVHESTLTPMDEALPQCLAQAVQGWSFPNLIESDSARLVHSFVFPLQ